MPRPSRLTAERRETIARQFAAGATMESAAIAAGVSGRTLRRWLRRGRDAGGGAFRDLVDEVERAKAQARVWALAGIGDAAAAGDWRAAAWLLEQLFPDEFAPPPSQHKVQLLNEWRIAPVAGADPREASHS